MLYVWPSMAFPNAGAKREQEQSTVAFSVQQAQKTGHNQSCLNASSTCNSLFYNTHSMALCLCETFILLASSLPSLFTCQMLGALQVILKTTCVTFTAWFKTCHAVKLLAILLDNSRLHLATAIFSHWELKKTRSTLILQLAMILILSGLKQALECCPIQIPVLRSICRRSVCSFLYCFLAV